MLEHLQCHLSVPGAPARQHDEQRAERNLDARGGAVVGELPAHPRVEVLGGQDRIEAGRPQPHVLGTPDGGEFPQPARAGRAVA
jgi:hypothetical protein